MAWGQGELIATPASMARVASAIANQGTLMHSRYVMKVSDSTLPLEEGVPLLKDAPAAALMTDYMKKQSANKKERLGILWQVKQEHRNVSSKANASTMAGMYFLPQKQKGRDIWWFVSALRKQKVQASLCDLAGSHVIPILTKYGYITGFGEKLN